MKLSCVLTAVVVATLLCVGSARAATIGLGVLAEGDSGYVSSMNLAQGGSYKDIVHGVLSSNTAIQFVIDLQVPSTKLDTFSASFGQYDYEEAGRGAKVTKSVLSDVRGNAPGAVDITDAVISAIAQQGVYTWSMTIANNTADYLTFASYFKMLVAKAKGGVYSISYSVMHTPVPPALLLFATGLMVFAGVAMRKKSGNGAL